MKLEISKAANPVGELFKAPLGLSGEVELKKLSISEELLQIMTRQGVSRTELARRMEVGPSRITSMFTGSNNFTIETLVKAGRALGVELHLNFGSASSKPPSKPASVKKPANPGREGKKRLKHLTTNR